MHVTRLGLTLMVATAYYVANAKRTRKQKKKNNEQKKQKKDEKRTRLLQTSSVCPAESEPYIASHEAGPQASIHLSNEQTRRQQTQPRRNTFWLEKHIISNKKQRFALIHVKQHVSLQHTQPHKRACDVYKMRKRTWFFMRKGPGWPYIYIYIRFYEL